MTNPTKVLLLSVVVLSFSAGTLGAEGITIHGASWGQSEDAPPPAAAVSAAQPPKQSGGTYKNPHFKYGRGVQYRGRIRYAGGFAFSASKQLYWAHHWRTSIRYAGNMGRNTRFEPSSPRRYGNSSSSYGNRIQYGHGQGYGLSR